MTNISILWIEGLTNTEYVDRVKMRLSNIDVDGILTPAEVEEYVTGSRWTAFPLLQYTQRPDRFCQGLLDGRVGLLVDGIPLGYLAPVDIGYLMDSPEDYSRDFVTASAVRILRYLALIIDLLLPALYVALTMFHWNMLPESMAQVISQGRIDVPFSPMWEILMLLLAFELLQESGVHLPQNFGQSVSIIGGIVVGTVGVEAGLISSLALITVSISGVCGFVLPNRDLAGAVRVWRFFLTVLASCFGLWGVGAGVAVLILRLGMVKSLGVSYLIPFEPGLLRKRMKNQKQRDGKLKTLDQRKRK
jgi:spore germination protein KA